jgi:hypothetical protein
VREREQTQSENEIDKESTVREKNKEIEREEMSEKNKAREK